MLADRQGQYSQNPAHADFANLGRPWFNAIDCVTASNSRRGASNHLCLGTAAWGRPGYLYRVFRASEVHWPA